VAADGYQLLSPFVKAPKGDTYLVCRRSRPLALQVTLELMDAEGRMALIRVEKDDCAKYALLFRGAESTS
jgi:hypothetical protein